MRLGQELFLVRDDLRERVCIQCSMLLLVRKTGSGLGKQRDHMVEAERTFRRRTTGVLHGRLSVLHGRLRTCRPRSWKRRQIPRHRRMAQLESQRLKDR